MLNADVVVIGAGTAGAVVARRLVDAGAGVILVEAGGEDTNPAIHEPGRIFELWGSPEDWNYYSAPQAHAFGRRLHMPRGRVVGGSSALSGMIHTRGYRGDYDSWAYLGNDGWSYADVLPLFKRSESFDGGEDELRGRDGPLHVSLDYPRHPVHESLAEGAQEVGLRLNPDYNGAEIEGISWTQLCIRDGVRVSAASAFLRPIIGHPNFELLTGCRALQLLFDDDRCVGVEIYRRRSLERALARTEVVLSCGTIESPRLLIISGIGPAEELRRLGVEVRVDLRGVGRNLHDHALVPIVHATESPVPPMPAGTWAAQLHLFTRSRPGLTAPDLQPIFFSIPAYSESWMEGPPEGFTLMAGIIRPASRGSIRLPTAHPSDELAIDPNYLACDADVYAMLAAVELCREIASSSAVAEWGPRELYPGPETTTRRELEEYVRRTVVTYHHPVGTCAMGIGPDAVVDPELRVHGVTGLRVADASVMPSITSGNTAAPAMLIGERAADLICSSSLGAVPVAEAPLA